MTEHPPKLLLTAEEGAEIRSRPPGTFIKPDDERFALRLTLAKKFCDYFLDDDNTLTAEHREIYQRFPMWAFYEGVPSGSCQRVYGVAMTTTGEPMLHTITKLLTHNNVGVISCDAVRRIDTWNEDQLSSLSLTANGWAFTDPLGFLAILYRLT